MAAIQKQKTTPKLIADVMTLKEAAAYLRISASELKSLAESHKVPARFIAKEWRFFKPALNDWLRGDPEPQPGTKERILQYAGSMKDDPDWEEMLAEIYRQRGRPMVDER